MRGWNFVVNEHLIIAYWIRVYWKQPVYYCNLPLLCCELTECWKVHISRRIEVISMLIGEGRISIYITIKSSMEINYRFRTITNLYSCIIKGIYLCHTVICSFRLPYPTANYVLSITAEERKLHKTTNKSQLHANTWVNPPHWFIKKRNLTLRTHCTIMVPVVWDSSRIWDCMSMLSHFGRKSSSQKKSLTISGVASSNIVLLRYWGGPV